MPLVPRNSLFDHDNFLSDFWAPATSDREGKSLFAPRVDIRERDDHYQITAELPGVKKEDIHVTLHDGVLTLEAETKEESSEKEDGKVIRQERRYGRFMRSFNLGDSVEEADIKASFDDGVLTLEAPKASEKPPSRRRIDIG
jgi:HSP20 family protein